MQIPFVKAHGAGNDFLLTWDGDAPFTPELARAICHRHSGPGADGWMLVSREPRTIRLLNSDGSEAELSGNGTRCAAALLVRDGLAEAEFIIQTGAGPKQLRLISRDHLSFLFEMNMGAPRLLDAACTLPLASGAKKVTPLDVGNPQCVVLVDDFELDWRAMGAEIERHPHFPNRTNVSFVRRVDAHAIDVRFFERGAGETLSSGTGSTGAAFAALHHGLVSSPVRVLTPAGPLELRQSGDALYLTGPAVIVAEGIFHYDEHECLDPPEPRITLPKSCSTN